MGIWLVILCTPKNPSLQHSISLQLANQVLTLQDLQNNLDRETSSLQELEAQKQDAQDRLDEMDQQKTKLKDMLSDVRQKCQEETQVVRNREGIGMGGEKVGSGLLEQPGAPCAGRPDKAFMGASASATGHVTLRLPCRFCIGCGDQ